MVARVLAGNGWQPLVEGLSGEDRGHLQAAEQVAQRLGVAVECCAAVAVRATVVLDADCCRS
jgi:hypothetical protein